MLETVLFIILICVVFLLCLNHWFKSNEFEKLPGPKMTFIFGNALDFLMDPVKLFYKFRKLSNTYKDRFKLKLGPKKFVAVYNPHDVEILISGTDNIKKGFLYKFLKPWLNEGLLLSDGSKWHHRRKILTPTFHFNILKQFTEIIKDKSNLLLEKINMEVNEPKTEILPLISDFTLNTICETAMGIKLNEDTNDDGRRYKDGIIKLGQCLVYRGQRIWTYANCLYSLSSVGRKQKEILDLIFSFRDRVINKRRSLFINNDLNISESFVTNSHVIDDTSQPRRKAFLDLLLQAEKEGTIDIEGMREEMDTFMFEGHDTVATALQFTLLLLANYPAVQDRVVEECYKIFGSSFQLASMEDLTQMKYLECCIKEAMRLYPPVYFIMRKIDKTVKLKEYMVPAGIECAIIIYDLHRNEEQFSEPLEFRPERFMVEKPTWHPFAYIPFSAGPRNCIGQKFAMIEMKLVLSAIIHRYRMLPVTKIQDLVFVTDVILRTKYPIYVKFEKRDTEYNN